MIDSAPLSEHITFIGVRRLISILETMNCVDTFWPTSLYPYIIIGDENMEIKKQITGMRRLLNDSTGRIYQRVGKEGEKLKEEPQDLELVWPQRLNSSAEAPQGLHPPSRGAWNELPTQSGELPGANSSAGSNCCTCSCQSTLQAILQELKTMRKLMQFQAVGTQNRQQPPISLICSQRTAVSRKRNKKKKVLPKTVEPVTVKPKPSPLEIEKKPAAMVTRPSGLQATELTSSEESHVLGFGIVLESPSSDLQQPILAQNLSGSVLPTVQHAVVFMCVRAAEPSLNPSPQKPEVQLAEGFDVFMPKSQLDSILSNYTRSGSLLFRKLVCAFFDDKTLANSLPNGKRKRGLNDNRKGLDQNIVGAIKGADLPATSTKDTWQAAPAIRHPGLVRTFIICLKIASSPPLPRGVYCHHVHVTPS
ncbi:BEN domain containing 7 [Cricetulus griseus]